MLRLRPDMKRRRGVPESQLQALADSPWRLTATALESPAISNSDLERLLQFLSEVNDVLSKAFTPLRNCLTTLSQFTPADLGSSKLKTFSAELLEIQQLEYYNVRLVCNRLHGLKDHAHKHIDQIISSLPERGEWWSLFGRLDEREGFVESIVRQTIGEMATKLAGEPSHSEFVEIQRNAKSALEDVSAALQDLNSYGMLMHEGADRIGFLALTDLSRTSLRQHVIQHLHIERMNVMGDVFSNISNSTIINRSHLENSFNKLIHQGHQDAADALKRAAEEVDKSGDKNVSELFDSFNEQLEKPAPKKSLLANSWKGLTEALPTLLKLPGVALTIVKLIDTFS
jgi:hypothetical protein